MSGKLTEHQVAIVLLGVTVALVAVAAATYRWWLPAIQGRLALGDSATELDSDRRHGGGKDRAHAEHNHGHTHESTDSIELSDVAWKNIGLKTGKLEPQTFVRTVSVPAVVVERPGRSQVQVTAPLTGIVTRVYPIEGEALEPGASLFDLRLTHEDLVTAQRDFLRSAEELDVVGRELRRLESIGDGVIAGRRVLEQEYDRQKLEAALHAQRQGLLLHGLSQQQIDEIESSRQLLQSLTVRTPPFGEPSEHAELEHVYHVQKISVNRGEQVSAGDTLAVLGDHCVLYIEGKAFEEDAARLVQASRQEWLIDVVPVGTKQQADSMRLKILYVADQVEADSRALRFYLSLPNEQVRDEQAQGHRFVAWKYRPGTRFEVKLPLGEPWKDQLVLPPEAVVDEGAEAFVFERNGSHFDRVPVHVLYRDSDAVVIANDGTLVGSTIALSGAYQMHLAIKNQAGGGVDPHAGHSH